MVKVPPASGQDISTPCCEECDQCTNMPKRASSQFVKLSPAYFPDVWAGAGDMQPGRIKDRARIMEIKITAGT
jgi:hypothetical protein